MKENRRDRIISTLNTESQWEREISDLILRERERERVRENRRDRIIPTLNTESQWERERDRQTDRDRDRERTVYDNECVYWYLDKHLNLEAVVTVVLGRDDNCNTHIPTPYHVTQCKRLIQSFEKEKVIICVRPQIYLSNYSH